VRVHVVIRGSRNRRGARRGVYWFAGGEAYYTTPEKKDSIAYEGEDLHIRVAFANKSKATTFINNLGTLNPPLGSNTIEQLGEDNYDEELGFTNAIYGWHYHSSDDTGSPPGSRDSGTTDQVVILGRDKRSRIVQFQSLESMAMELMVGFEMAHILDKRYCNDAQKKDETNFFALSPTLHKMFDGTAGRSPTIVIDIEDNGETPQVVAEGSSELRYRVLLSVLFKDPGVAETARSAIVFKDQAETRDQGLKILVSVDVLDFAKFKMAVVQTTRVMMKVVVISKTIYS